MLSESIVIDTESNCNSTCLNKTTDTSAVLGDGRNYTVDCIVARQTPGQQF